MQIKLWEQDRYCQFINARSEQEIIFAQRPAHAINMLAIGFNFKPGDVVLLTAKNIIQSCSMATSLQKAGLIKVVYAADERFL